METHFAQHGFVKTLEPGVGVLAHVTSLPSGRFGVEAHRFIDWLAEAGIRYWQILPLNPTDKLGSPYAGISAFAGNPELLEEPAELDAWVMSDSATAEHNDHRNQANGDRHALHDPIPTDSPRSQQSHPPDWLEEYAAFMQERAGTDPAVTYREQREFDRQWHELRTYANERNVCIIGDLPIYVGSDSADVWAHPELFQLDEQGNPTAGSGCPPDAFAPEGQLWNNPLYDWEAMASDGFRWWIERLRRAFELYDIVRLDHFIGFAHYYSIPAGHSASEGFYRPGPGIELFRKAFEELGPLPVIAEDLGNVTDEVRQLVAECGFLGMDVLQFQNDPLCSYDLPPNVVAYTGTHDNQTLVGYCRSRYPDLNPGETADILLSRVRDCAAPLRIFPVQDLLGLDDEARMNTPGTTTDNWAWRLPELNDSLRQALHRTHGN